MSEHLTASWQRLPDDSWGLRIIGLPPPQNGDEVRVQKKSGEESWETVGEIVHTSGALTIARHVPRYRSRGSLGADDAYRADDYEDD